MINTLFRFMKISKKIKQLRIKNNVTQNEVAEFLSIDRTIITKYENGTLTPDDGVLLKLSKYYDVSIDELKYSSFSNFVIKYHFIINVLMMFLAIAGILILTLPITKDSILVTSTQNPTVSKILEVPASLLSKSRTTLPYINYFSLSFCIICFISCPFSLAVENRTFKYYSFCFSLTSIVLAILLLLLGLII